jgi:putative ATPase
LSSKVEADQRSSSQRQRRQDPENNLAPIFSLTPKPRTDPSTRTLSAEPDVSATDPSGSSNKRKIKDQSLPQTVSSKRKKTGPSNLQSAAPLAERLRPSSLEEFVGQNHLLKSGSLISNMLDTGSIGSIIFWGPPGCVFHGILLSDVQRFIVVLFHVS